MKNPDFLLSNADFTIKGANRSFELAIALTNWRCASPVNRRPVRLALIDGDERIVWNYTLPGVSASDWQPTVRANKTT